MPTSSSYRAFSEFTHPDDISANLSTLRNRTWRTIYCRMMISPVRWISQKYLLKAEQPQDHSQDARTLPRDYAEYLGFLDSREERFAVLSPLPCCMKARRERCAGIISSAKRCAQVKRIVSSAGRFTAGPVPLIFAPRKFLPPGKREGRRSGIISELAITDL